MPTPTDKRTEFPFSYGTLQLESVQLSLFGRTLSGHRDTLPKFEHALLKIDDPAKVAALGQTHHAIAKFTGNIEDEVAGTALLVTMDELLKADAYEPPEYRRVRVVLRSGTNAWVYVDVAHGSPGHLPDEVEESAGRESPAEALRAERDAR